MKWDYVRVNKFENHFYIVMQLIISKINLLKILFLEKSIDWFSTIVSSVL